MLSPLCLSVMMMPIQTMNLDLKIHLRELVNIGQVLIQWNIFGSNGYIEQPDRIVSSFTRRQAEDPELEYAGPTKYFVNSNYEFWRLDVHCARFVSDEEDKNNFIIVSRQFYIINHYRIQSKQFWDTVKLTRGDADDFRIRTEEEFYLSDFNDVEDLRLAEQNLGLGEPTVPPKPPSLNTESQEQTTTIPV